MFGVIVIELHRARGNRDALVLHGVAVANKPGLLMRVKTRIAKHGDRAIRRQPAHPAAPAGARSRRAPMNHHNITDGLVFLLTHATFAEAWGIHLTKVSFATSRLM